jgi:hypothetical protein
MSLQLCHPYVWEDPRYMFRAWSTDANCVSELVNRVVVTYLVFIIIGFVLSSFTQISMLPFAAGIAATALLIPTFISLSKAQKEKFKPVEITRDVSGASPLAMGKEGFLNEKVGRMPLSAFGETGTPGNPGTLPFQGETQAHVRNPFHNILIDEYVYSPTREAAPDITTTQSKVDLDAMFRTQWYSDPTDVFGKTQSQRMFVTAPVTTIPNDQGSYQNWLYKIPGKTCKEGNQDACYGGSEGAVMPWLNL